MKSSASKTSLSQWRFDAPLLLALDVRWVESGSCGLLAVGTKAGNFEHGEFWRKARGPRGRIEAFGHRRRRNFADRAAAVADQKRHHRRVVMRLRTGEI